jgi:hypothetical protein
MDPANAQDVTRLRYGRREDVYTFEIPCIRYTLDARMTLVLAALCPTEGIVVSADGLVVRTIEGSGEEVVFGTNAVKTARLNPALCVGFAGDVFVGNEVFARLIGVDDDSEWCGIKEGCEKWERLGMSIPLTFMEALGRVDEEVQRAREAAGRVRQKTEDYVPAVLLAGYDGAGKPRIARWGEPDWVLQEETDFGRIVGIGAELDDATLAIGGIPIRQRMISVIRCRSFAPPKIVGSNVSIRRKSQGFKLEWNNWRALNSSSVPSPDGGSI